VRPLAHRAWHASTGATPARVFFFVFLSACISSLVFCRHRRRFFITENRSLPQGRERIQKHNLFVTKNTGTRPGQGL
jgi:cell division protein FtsL